MSAHNPTSALELPTWSERLRTRAFVMPVLFIFAALCAFYTARFAVEVRTPVSATPGVLWPDGVPIDTFELTDQYGEAFGPHSLRGRWTLLTFGYTHCPDVCPMSVNAVSRAVQSLRERVDENLALQSVFVSVDPARDTAARLKSWAGFFDPALLAVSGDHEALARFSKQVAATYVIGESDDAGQYLVQHTSSVMLIDPDARLVASIGFPFDEQHLLETVSEVLRHAGH